MKRVRQRIKALTGRGRVGTDIREVISWLNPILRGWGNYFRTGNAAIRFNQIDWYVVGRLRGLMRKRYGRNLRPGQSSHLDARVVRGPRPLPPAWHHPLPGNSVVTIMKIIGKPCAGKPHARIERGMGKRALMAPRP